MISATFVVFGIAMTWFGVRTKRTGDPVYAMLAGVFLIATMWVGTSIVSQ